MIRLLTLFTLVQFNFNAAAQELNDGPYVSYEGDKIVFRSISAGKMISSTVPISQKKAAVAKVIFSEHPKWNFTVPLKSTLKEEKSEFSQPEKLLFLSDIEGEFEGFRSLLIASGVMSESYKWMFGRGHLVICGDLFDRGTHVPEAMWLLYKLESLAVKAGGYVHVILGNHDIMNLSGDLRYLQKKYIESAKVMGLDYMSLYGTESELGRWLRTKNTIEKIGDNLCMHAGVAPLINGLKLSVTEINQLCRPYYDKVKLLRGVGNPAIDPFYTGATSLFWYRGYFSAPKATEEEVNTTLNVFNVSRIIVGHTIMPGNVGFYYGGKVLGLDVNGHAGDCQAALFDNGKWIKIDSDGKSMPLQ
ncbi:metallophosphoesterase [Pedobacter sp. Du54]|uniref:metallophosphoesterase n=1 Tax=Pedobacter anseongensis TaxID=3133439 RepID=UPI00309CA93E